MQPVYVLMSLCDSDTKNQVESMNKLSNLEARLDTIGLFDLINKLEYTGGTNDLNRNLNKAMAHMNLMILHHDRFQDIQDLRDQFIIWNELELILADVKVKAVLKEKGVLAEWK